VMMHLTATWLRAGSSAILESDFAGRPSYVPLAEDWERFWGLGDGVIRCTTSTQTPVKPEFLAS
jgi:hypothetical protein